MVEEGVLENPKANPVSGARVYPLLPVGKVGVYEQDVDEDILPLGAGMRVIEEYLGLGLH